MKHENQSNVHSVTEPKDVKLLVRGWWHTMSMDVNNRIPALMETILAEDRESTKVIELTI